VTSTHTPKALAWIGIPLVLAAILAIINSVSQGFLWEIPNTRSIAKTADAAGVSADADKVAANAQATDAANKLLAAIEAAKAVTEAGRLQADSNIKASQNIANATMEAAKRQAEEFYHAAHETVRAENSQYDQITKPLFSDPAEKMDALNREIVRTTRELRNGRNATTGQALSVSEIADRQQKLAVREEELETVKQTTNKNWKDAMEMLMGTTNGLFGGLGDLYPTGNEAKPVRRIIQEP